MIRRILIVGLVATSSFSFAQNQQGYVKTKGRLGNNGAVIKGNRLPGATVTVKGRNAVVSGNNGSFTLSVPGNNYYLQDVQKKGYVIIDPEMLSRQYVYSMNPLILVLESQEQLLDDKLQAERRIRRTLQRQLQQREDEIDALREENKITKLEYQEQLQKLFDDQDNNEKLIGDMAERYSKIDYDQLDEFNTQISNYILEGEIKKADSLLKTKGDINMRTVELRKLEEQNAKDEVDLANRRKELERRKELAKNELVDLSQDCYSKFEIFKLRHLNDSALYYLECRANLDSTNIEWKLQVSQFLREYIGNYKMAMDWSSNALKYAISMYGDESEVLERCYIDLGLSHGNMGDYNSALHDYIESLRICQRLNGTLHPNVAVRHAEIGMTYIDMGKYMEAEAELNTSLLIADSLKQNFEAKAYIFSQLGMLHEKLEKYEEALDYQKKALESEIAFNGLEHPNLITRYNNLASVYYELGNTELALSYFSKSLDLAKTIFDESHPVVTTILNNMGVIYYANKEYDKAITFFIQDLNVRQEMLDEKHPDFATIYLNIGNAYGELKQYDESEKYLRKALDIRSLVYGDDNPLLAGTYNSLGVTLLDQKKYNLAKPYFEKALKIRLSTYGSFSQKVSLCYGNLGRLYKEMGDKEEAIKCYKEAISSLPENHPNIAKLQKAIDDIHIGKQQVVK